MFVFLCVCVCVEAVEAKSTNRRRRNTKAPAVEEPVVEPEPVAVVEESAPVKSTTARKVCSFV